MKNSFDLRKFLVENKLTANSKMIKEDNSIDSIPQEFIDAAYEIGRQADDVAYGDIEDRHISSAYRYFKQGDFDNAVGELLYSYSDQDGGEVSSLDYVYNDGVAELEHLSKELGL